MLVLFICLELSMGGVCSEPASNNEVYRIPLGDGYKHRKCTVRAPHQFKVPQNCDYCHIVKKLNSVKTRYRLTTFLMLQRLDSAKQGSKLKVYPFTIACSTAAIFLGKITL